MWTHAASRLTLSTSPVRPVRVCSSANCLAVACWLQPSLSPNWGPLWFGVWAGPYPNHQKKNLHGPRDVMQDSMISKDKFSFHILYLLLKTKRRLLKLWIMPIVFYYCCLLYFLNGWVFTRMVMVGVSMCSRQCTFCVPFLKHLFLFSVSHVFSVKLR